MSESSSTTSSSLTESITPTFYSTLSQTISVTNFVTATITPAPIPNPSPAEPSPSSFNPYADPNLLCDWTRTAVDCRDSDFTKVMLVVSSAAHLLVALYGLWLLSYRNRGFNSRIVTELFIKIGTGVRPKPMDCIIFFTSVSCVVKVTSNLTMVFGALQSSLWLRIALEQLYWLFVAFAFSSYFVGLLYAMPVTARKGIFAVYQPEVAYGSKSLRPIHVLTPSIPQKNFMLIMGAVYPALFGAGLGIASGAMYDRGHYDASRVLMLLQYSNWVLILYTMAVMFFYYGLKYTFILRANIIIAETALKAPRAAFGIGNLKSRSPARFLFIQLQITGFGGCAVTVLAGTLCILWVLFRDNLLKMESDRLPHTIAVFWTCAIALAFFVVFSLIAAQSIRNRRRGLHEPSITTTMSNSGGPRSAGYEMLNSEQQHANRGSDPETRLTRHTTRDTNSLDSKKTSMERVYGYDDSRYIAMPADVLHRERAAVEVSAAATVVLPDRMDLNTNVLAADKRNSDSWRSDGLACPTRRLSTQTNSSLALTGNRNKNIRESVFGGRAPREDGAPASLPANEGGFEIPSYPVKCYNSSNGSIEPRLPPTSPTLSPAANSNLTQSVALQQQTQLQLQQLQMQQSRHDPGASSQRVRIKNSTFKTILENQMCVAADDNGDDLLYSDAMRNMQAPSSPPHSPCRTGSNASGSSLQTQLSPNMGSMPSMPLPPGTSLQSFQQYQQQQRQQQERDASFRLSTSSLRSHRQQLSQELNLPMELQLQQQHPLHQVAFKGLSPPPRSTPQILTSTTTPVRRAGERIASVSQSTPPTAPLATTSTLSAPSSPNVTAIATASRGAGGGYQSQRMDPIVPVPVPASQSPSLAQQHDTFNVHQQQSSQLDSAKMDDDNASIDSSGDDAWPMPPTFK
ncbi:hypothetical protein BGZ98_007949 [Dissophora globulifera]|nr:hypothetical protein BGZ98_007949 [Dissophora globulifera]